MLGFQFPFPNLDDLVKDRVAEWDLMSMSQEGLKSLAKA